MDLQELFYLLASLFLVLAIIATVATGVIVYILYRQANRLMERFSGNLSQMSGAVNRFTTSPLKTLLPLLPLSPILFKLAGKLIKRRF